MIYFRTNLLKIERDSINLLSLNEYKILLLSNEDDVLWSYQHIIISSVAPNLEKFEYFTIFKNVLFSDQCC